MLTIHAAKQTIIPMINFIKIIENYHNAETKRNCRPTADNDHFIEKIAEIYDEYIEKPSTYEDGTFFAIVRKVREILGLRHEYPKRAITQALNRYFSTH